MGNDALDIHTLLGMGPMAPVPNPYPLYKRLRDESPVLETRHTMDSAVAGNHRTVLITRYADVKAVLADNETYGSDIVNLVGDITQIAGKTKDVIAQFVGYGIA